MTCVETILSWYGYLKCYNLLIKTRNCHTKTMKLIYLYIECILCFTNGCIAYPFIPWDLLWSYQAHQDQGTGLLKLCAHWCSNWTGKENKLWSWISCKLLKRWLSPHSSRYKSVYKIILVLLAVSKLSKLCSV